mgnify:CR=1 FL=1
MIFHAKALEMLTIAYREAANIDTENDLEEFRNAFTQSKPDMSAKNLNLSNYNLNQKNPYDAMFQNQPASNSSNKNVTNSLPNSPRRGGQPPHRNPYTNSSSNNAGYSNSRAMPNDNINAANYNEGRRNQAANVIIQSGMGGRNYASEPDLNNDLNVQNLSDDSDAEQR